MPDDDQTRPTVGPEPLRPDPRLQSLDKRLDAAQAQEDVRTGRNTPHAKGHSQGMRVVSELIGGPLGGAIIGWVLDRLLGTKPWLLLVMLFVGFAVAVRNIYRISKQRPE
jgi:ATP synthase protein I